ncbi:hypothetical protein HHK36_015813 [Tetracentron sinense]|uniref:Signal peptidase complex subunit 1 n=1 Tax=Tetracentron sinense TaxID=13715 RepID=A0A834Z6V4_TETSI|nr:hypothetical protein HHK36_015813 [Tetracentron sinense]
MDWQGQKFAEQLMQIMLLAFSVVAFVTGYSMSSFQMMLLIYSAGVVLTTLITVPNWPFFNRHPLKWLDPVDAERHPKPQPMTSKKMPTKHYLNLLLSFSFRHCLPLHRTMDWQGQKFAEQLMQIMLLAFAVVAFVTGYSMSSFQMMLLIYSAGVVLTALITVPNWPFFNRHPLKWLDPVDAERHPKPQPMTSKKMPTKHYLK